jgi:hypothetical protein
VPTEIEGGVRREAGDQDGQNDEIRIVSSGKDHRDRPNLDQRETGEESVDSPRNAIDHHWAFLKADIGPTFPRWFANIKVLLWHFVDKMGGLTMPAMEAEANVRDPMAGADEIRRCRTLPNV